MSLQPENLIDRLGHRRFQPVIIIFQSCLACNINFLKMKFLWFAEVLPVVTGAAEAGVVLPAAQPPSQDEHIRQLQETNRQLMLELERIKVHQAVQQAAAIAADGADLQVSHCTNMHHWTCDCVTQLWTQHLLHFFFGDIFHINLCQDTTFSLHRQAGTLQCLCCNQVL